MNTGEYSGVEPHTDDSIESWIYFESLIDGLSSIVGAPAHNILDIEGVILINISTCCMDKKNRVVSF